MGHDGRWRNDCTGIKLLISKWVSQQYCCWQACYCGETGNTHMRTHTHNTHTHACTHTLSLSLSHTHTHTHTYTMNSYITPDISFWLQRQRMSLRHRKFIPYFWKYILSYSVTQTAPKSHRFKQGKFCRGLWMLGATQLDGLQTCMTLQISCSIMWAWNSYQ